ncbi:DUF3951 domain-containing protein [Paenibacillus sp. KN14-4R]|uniref:DUF3951 domain-containing protein n=1 Tax=Paenibacillus sp. KN14-4R TaxID=3445773 RepID=UPI003FA15696
MENFTLYLTLSLIIPILALLLIISVKIIKGKKLPDSNYTPFDYITGQTTVEFHEEKEAKEENDDQGDDKDRY